MDFDKLFSGKGEENLSLEDTGGENPESGRTLNLEARVSCKRGERRDVALALSRISLMGKAGYIVIVRDMSGRERIEHESTQLQNELHSSILMMNLPIVSLAKEYTTCDMDTPVHAAASIMQKKDQDALIITREGNEPVGILTDTEEPYSCTGT
jgi:hypothetical protein